MSSNLAIHVDVAGKQFPLIFAKIFHKYIERRRSRNDTDNIVLRESNSYQHFLQSVALPISHKNHPKGDLLIICNVSNENHDNIYLTYFKKLGVQINHNESKGTLDICAPDGSIDNLKIFGDMLFEGGKK